MAKYFLINQESLPEEGKKHISLVKYMNIGILFLLFIICIQKGNNLVKDTEVIISKIEEKGKIAIQQEQILERKLSEKTVNSINNVVQTFESEIKKESENISNPTNLSSQSGDENRKAIAIYIKVALKNEQLSSLLLSVFEELQALGEDEAYIDVERNKLGVVTVIHVKSIKNMNEVQIQNFIQKISNNSRVNIHK